MSQRNPEKILQIFDNNDLEDPEERRICLFTLNDYFGAVFTEVGEQLDFGTSDYDGSIGHQWNKASSRLEEVDSVEILGEYYEALNAIDSLRGNCAHDFNDFPPAEPIESARDTAPEWAEWIREAADDYEEYQESLTATEALVQVGERALDNIPEDKVEYTSYFQKRATDLRNQATDLDDNLQSFRDDEEITKDLVEVISEILEWERDKNQLIEEIEGWKQQEAERLEMEDRAENTYNFIVLDEVDEYDRIVLIKNQVGQPDHSYSITISNCPISDEEMNYLRNLESNEEVQLWMGSKMYRNRNGRINHEDIIKEVVDMP